MTRCYQTRHGPGPLVTEDPTLELPEPHNRPGRWQGPFRRGHLDAVALRYAIEAAGGVDAIALTHLDAARHQPLRLCESYLVGGRRVERLPVRRDRDLAAQERLTRALLRSAPRCGPVIRDWPAAVRDALGAPVAVLSSGPTAAAKTVLGSLDDTGYTSRSTTTGA